MSQPFKEYRGCAILVYPGLDPVRFGSPCTMYLRWTWEKVEDDIDATLGPAEEPEPDPEVDYVEKTYRGIDIWWKVALNAYWAMVATGYTAMGGTIPEIEGEIDRLLAYLEPDEDPETGLFAQVVANIRAWVLRNIQAWVTQWGKIVNNVTNYVNDSINYWGDQVTQYIDNSITYWTEKITNVYNDLRTYVDNSVTYIDRSVDYWGDQITQNITNVIGASTEWVNDRLSDVGDYINHRLETYAPQGFQSNPVEYVKVHAEDRFNLKVFEFIESFWEGFEEGLEE